MKLEITKNRVIEAASKCATAKETLKTLFPEAFEDDKYFTIDQNGPGLLPDEHPLSDHFQVRTGGEWAGKGFYLDDGVDWEVVKDSEDAKVLIPTKK